MPLSDWRSKFAVAGWVVAGLLGALVYSQWVTDEFSFRHLKGGHKTSQAQQERDGAKHAGAPLKDKPPASKYEADCEKSEKRDDCLLQLRMTEAAEVQAKAAEDQAQYTRLGLWLLFLTLLATGWAARGAGRAARAAERALVDLERPQVFVEVHSAGMGVNRGVLIFSSEFKYRFVNYGRTVAQIIDLNLRYPIEATTSMPPALSPDDPEGRRGLPAGVVSAPGAPYEETENLFVAFGGPLLETDGLIKNRLFFMGCVRYRDIFGAVNVVGFCFVFDPAHQLFVRIGDAPYNYIKQERKASPR